MSYPLIKVEDLSYSHPVRGGVSVPALRGISLDIEEGEYVAIVGANGSGKTTLARHFNGLLMPDEGKVLIQGMDTRDRHHMPAIHSLVGMIFQAPEDQLVAGVLEEDTAFGPENLGLPPEEIRKRVEQALRVTGLWEQRQRPPHLLSAGQMQRAALAGVLAMHPRCVIFDETTAMLDPDGRRMVQELIDSLHREGLTVIVITHFMQEAGLAERMVVLQGGQIALDGPPRQIFAQGDRLHALGLDLPRAARLAAQLRPLLPGIPDIPITLTELTHDFPAYDGAETPGKTEANVPCENGGWLSAEHLEHTYLKDTPLAHVALRDVSICVEESGQHGLIGATGSGKSTLLQHLNGLLAPQAGKVKIGPFDLNDPDIDLKAVRRFSGLVFQNPDYQMFEQYVGDEVAYAPRLLGETDTLRETVRWAMETAGLDFEKFKDRFTFTLSGGEKRKVALASTLAMRPRILLLDEPTAGLDPLARQEIITNLLDLHKKNGITLVVSSHHMEDVADLATHITALNDGRDWLRGPAGRVFQQEDQLAAAGLEAPLTAQLVSELRKRGWPLADGIVRPEQLVQAMEILVRSNHG